MAMKKYSTFPKAPVLLEPHHQIVKCHIQDPLWWSFPSAEKQSVYSTAPANWEMGVEVDLVFDDSLGVIACDS